ncbi:MAG: SDR family oxidoreductase [Emcibacteraceae bacterium]|nr:SDR family oxidoreductase [Emcibacteraceae bacterium]
MSLLEDFQLMGKNIVVTGASSGLGREIAVAFSEVGANVALVGRNEVELMNTLALMRDGSHRYFIFDVTNNDEYDVLFENIKNELGLISGFVHSAGIEFTLPLKSSSAAKYRQIFEINTIAALELSRVLLKKKYRSTNVSVLYVSSTMSVVGAPALIAYSASKGALVASVRSAALEYANRGVRFNCLSPGHIEGTQMATKLFDKLSNAAQENLVSKHPLGLGTPRDVANASVFLLSDASRWITGINLMIDGGYSAQ